MGEQLKLKRSFWWVPYDPNGFICDRKVKNRLSAYNHCRIPEIEQYANQDEWVEGTLIEEITEEEKMEQAMKNLEKTLDLDSFGHVSFKIPQQTRVGTSTAATSQQPAQESTTPAARTPKGKEVLDSEQHKMLDQPASSKQQGQGKIPPVQTKAPEVPTLQTPLNEEKGRKRDREETTPVSGPAEQPGAKRQRVDPLPEEEIIEEIIESPRSEKATRPQTSPVLETSTSSHRQELEKQHSVEISSVRPQSKQGFDIKRTFTDIKAQNEPIRLQLYDQFLKMTPTKQQRLMSAYDIKEGKMILSDFNPKVQWPQSAADYIRTNLEALSKDIHPMD